MNATTQELQSQNWDLQTLAAHNGISPSQVRGTDLLIRQIEHVIRQESFPVLESQSIIDLAKKLGLDFHICFKGRHQNIYVCVTHGKEIPPLFSAFGMLHQRIFCECCGKTAPLVFAKDLGLEKE